MEKSGPAERNSTAWRRLPQVALIVSFLALSWLGMMIVHELGHVVGSLATGGRVSKVVLHPLAISRTDLSHNPRPLLVSWAGPLFGVFVPVLAWTLAALTRSFEPRLWRFFAGFCLIANGAYLAFGSLEGVGDAGDMLRHGAADWQLWAFGALAIPLGFLCWHNTGESFGFGSCKGQVNVWATCVSMILLCIVLGVELSMGGEWNATD
jgi:hypothetical protein